jgi:hypothetical protein
MTELGRRPGRPRTKHESGSGDYIGFRVPYVLKARLHNDAVASGRSLSTEVQFRLEQSIRGETASHALESTFGPQGGALAMLIGMLVRQAPGACNLPIEGDWLNNPNAFAWAAEEIRAALDELAPPGDAIPEVMANAPGMARWTIFNMLDAPAGSNLAAVRAGLGTAVVERLTKKRRERFGDQGHPQ